MTKREKKLCFLQRSVGFGYVNFYSSLWLKINHSKYDGNSPSLDGVTALLDAGLAGVGEAAGTGIATDSVGVVPA